MPRMMVHSSGADEHEETQRCEEDGCYPIQCEAPSDCEEPATFQADSPTPGGTIHLCDEHARPPCTMLIGNTRCGKPAIVTTVSLGETCHFCAECSLWGL